MTNASSSGVGETNSTDSLGIGSSLVIEPATVWSDTWATVVVTLPLSMSCCVTLWSNASTQVSAGFLPDAGDNSAQVLVWVGLVDGQLNTTPVMLAPLVVFVAVTSKRSTVPTAMSVTVGVEVNSTDIEYGPGTGTAMLSWPLC